MSSRCVWALVKYVINVNHISSDVYCFFTHEFILIILSDNLYHLSEHHTDWHTLVWGTGMGTTDFDSRLNFNVKHFCVDSIEWGFMATIIDIGLQTLATNMCKICTNKVINCIISEKFRNRNIFQEIPVSLSPFSESLEKGYSCYKWVNDLIGLEIGYSPLRGDTIFSSQVIFFTRDVGKDINQIIIQYILKMWIKCFVREKWRKIHIFCSKRYFCCLCQSTEKWE